jgi:hypothetical protein
MWCVPQLNGEYIERMEDIQTLYNRPLNPKEPVVCFDEKPIQLLANARPGRMLGNRIRRVDHEYRRRGTANIFCAIEPKAGRHIVQPTLMRKKADFARMLAHIAKSYESVDLIHLVVDNLNTHRESSIIEAFGDKKAKHYGRNFLCITHQNKRAGSIRPKSKLACCLASASVAGSSRQSSVWTQKLRFGEHAQTACAESSTGNLLFGKHVPSANIEVD